MKLSEILADPSFVISKFKSVPDEAPKGVIYFKERDLTDTKQTRINKPLYEVIAFTKEGRTVGILILPKYKWTLYSNGVMIQHSNFKLRKEAVVNTELSYWSEVHFITNVENTFTMIAKSYSDTPNY